MKLHAFFLRAAAFMLLMFGALFIGIVPALYVEQRSVVGGACSLLLGLLFLAGAAMAYLPARRLVRQLGDPIYAPAHRWSVPFQPAPGEGWRPAEHWALLPDPVPDAPRPKSWAQPGLPAELVPPDETLRRLLLVRSHLRTYRGTARGSKRFFSSIGFGFTVVVVPMAATSGVMALTAGYVVGFAFLTIALALVYPCWRNAVVVGKDWAAQVRRYRALKREEHRLAALASQHPAVLPERPPRERVSGRSQPPADSLVTPPPHDGSTFVRGRRPR